MPYLGKSPQHGNYSKLDDFSGDFDGSDATHAIASNSIAITPVRPEALIISINGVIQEPTTDYTVSGTNITFTTAPTAGDNFFGVAMGEQLQIGTPSDATITSAKLSGNLVTPGTLDVNGQELILDADADTSITADTDDQIDIKIAGADDFQFTANTLTALSGSTIAIASGATIANSGTATGFSLTGIDDQSSSNDDQLTIKDTEVVVNDDSDDVDFRVESNGNANMLVVNGGEDKVGVGILTPLSALHVQGASGAVTSWSVGVNNDDLVVENNSHCGLSMVSLNDYSCQIIFLDSDSHAGGAGMIYFNNDSNQMRFYTDDANDGATLHFQIANDGTLTGTDTSIGSISDERLKENISDYTYDLETFKKFKPKTFDWKNPGQHGNKSGVRGFIAQDLLVADPYWCSTLEVDKEIHKPDSVNPDISLVDGALNIGGVAVEAGTQYTSHLGKKDSMYISVINQLIAKIETLETRVSALES